MERDSTIVAMSTAYGEGGIGIVRISGEKAGAILGRLFGRGDGAGFEDRHMYYGRVVRPETGEVIDEALFVFMRAPRTYTGEDVAEIQCHGSVVSLRRVLEAALVCGAEPASPGEFTQRAFLNGRIDLTQAEAVIDVVQAKTDASARAAVAQLGGGLSARVGEIRGLLADALALAAVHIDYPDDDKDFTDPDSAQLEMAVGLRAAAVRIDSLIATANTGRLLREGLNVVIAGAANTGKSSLLNALLRDSRAIVTDIPGTTRDSIEEGADIRGLPVRLTDTAGVRETAGEIERLGIDRTKEAVADADLVLFLVDGSKGVDENDIAALRSVTGAMGAPPETPSSGRLAFIINKSDLPQVMANGDMADLLHRAGISIAFENGLYTILFSVDAGEIPPGPARAALRGDGVKAPCGRLYTIPLSAKTGDGLSDLEDLIERAVYCGRAPQADESLVTNVRHKDLLVRAAAGITDAIGLLEGAGDIDLAEADIRSAWDSLGEITGETATDDILERIFSRFCIGK
jgi:tRNA modification GTPase